MDYSSNPDRVYTHQIFQRTVTFLDNTIDSFNYHHLLAYSNKNRMTYQLY